MTNKQQRKFWTANERYKNKFVRKYAKVFRKALGDQINELVSYVKFAPNGQAVLDSIPTLMGRDDLTKAFNDLYIDVGVKYAGRYYSMIKRAAEAKKEDTLADFQYIWTAQMAMYVNNEAAIYINSIIATSQRVAERIVQSILKQALDEGLSIPETMELLEKRIPVEWRIASKWRSELIARTEVLTASNYGAETGGNEIADELGLELNKVWISKIDSRTRTIPPDQADHVVMNGVQVPRNGTFDVPGTSANMRHPGDPSGGAKNRCNCRCTVAFVRADGQTMFSQR